MLEQACEAMDAMIIYPMKDFSPTSSDLVGIIVPGGLLLAFLFFTCFCFKQKRKIKRQDIKTDLFARGLDVVV
jgi:TRAP-type C4-dicarboxylate transport system permease large subunit